MDGGQEHPAGFESHHGSWGQIRNCDTGLSDELLRFVVGMDARQNRAILTGSVVQRELQELLGLRYGFAGKHLDRAEIALGEGLKVHKILEQRLDLYIREVDLFFNGSRFLRLLRRLASLLRGTGETGTLEIGGCLRSGFGYARIMHCIGCFVLADWFHCRKNQIDSIEFFFLKVIPQVF